MAEDSKDISSLKAGQSVVCRVEAPEPGGYTATILNYDLEAFLPSREELQIGQIVPATFVCMSGNRALMTFAYMIGTTERVQFGLPSEQETAFAVWADSYPRNFRLRRAVDIIMPSLTGKLNHAVKSADFDVKRLLADLAASELTGCIKAESSEVLSRSAALLYKGRVVGCIYGRKPQPQTQVLEASLKAMMDDLMLQSTEMQVYELPDEVVIAMSALFLGVPIGAGQTADAGDPKAYIKDLMPSLAEKNDTACVMVSTTDKPSRILGFVHQGKPFGSYSIVDQNFTPGFEQLHQLCDESDDAVVNAYLLPKEMQSEKVVYGYALTTFSKN
ncbi:hypothetical protein KF707_00940 [Candidatus Obscuribacterales bacterium]|jgi:hypothetical protein|nr:hypothetical protein [Candidatus Obscuribacterales bacterium]MBX3134768.1 hypothetical protein [Candidatus Obscuribacterales bacterium]